MHMSDALLSPPVALSAGIVSALLIGVSASRIKHEDRDGDAPLMGVLGAFVFAAQMINFTIPGTGSSGHIIGWLLLAALLGPWRGFITLCSVLIVQCLVFADGGLLALGCNIINMAAMSCLVAYPLVFKPLLGQNLNKSRIMLASVVASVVGLELGAFMVSVETVLSGISALPMNRFILFMLPIHLAIGICEGIATGLVLVFVSQRAPAMMMWNVPENSAATRKSRRSMVVIFAVAALILAVAFAWIASENPDGLEWAIMKLTGSTELAPSATPSTAFMPDYESHLSGIVGGIIVMMILWAVSMMIFRRKPQQKPRQ